MSKQTSWKLTVLIGLMLLVAIASSGILYNIAIISDVAFAVFILAMIAFGLITIKGQKNKH